MSTQSVAETHHHTKCAQGLNALTSWSNGVPEPWKGMDSLVFACANSSVALGPFLRAFTVCNVETLYHASPAQSFSSPACASFIERFSRRATAVIFGYKHLGITTATSVCWGRVSRPCCKRLQAASQLPPRTNDLQSIQCDGGTGRFLNQPFARLNFPRQPFAREFCMVSF